MRHRREKTKLRPVSTSRAVELIRKAQRGETNGAVMLRTAWCGWSQRAADELEAAGVKTVEFDVEKGDEGEKRIYEKARRKLPKKSFPQIFFWSPDNLTLEYVGDGDDMRKALLEL